MRKLFFLLVFIGLLAADELKLTREQMRLLGIELAPVKEQELAVKVKMPAEVAKDPRLVYRVHSPAEGILKKLLVQEGQRVKKGQRLALVWSSEVAELKAELSRARVELETAQKRYEKLKKLYAQKVVKFVDVFEAELELIRARGRVRSLSALLSSYGETEGPYLVLRAPRDGVVSKLSVYPGDAVSPEELILELSSYERVWVYGYAPAEASVREGAQGTVLKGELRVGCRVGFVARELDPKTRRRKVRCEANNAEGYLLPGEFVELTVSEGKVKGLFVPVEAVQTLEGRTVVFVYENGRFKPVEVKVLGEADGHYRVEGLKPGQVIAVKGTFFLKSKFEGVEGGH
ncbi:MAG: efflux RND transporter periplasmic adaptor subunit [Aquificae bacterium]|nr:efflux RND transporter periplasmic adaptor subunit [Aquificota bacterium]